MRLAIVAISAYPDIVPKARTTIGGWETNRYPLPSSGYHLWGSATGVQENLLSAPEAVR